MAYRIILRRDTSTNWTTNNPVLLLGEPGFETDTSRMKIGDGSTLWEDLPYYVGYDLLALDSNLIPATGGTYDLGATAGYSWRDLYLSGNTIYLGDATLSAIGSSVSIDTIILGGPTADGGVILSATGGYLTSDGNVIMGPSGDTGPTGPTGPQGNIGPTGSSSSYKVYTAILSQSGTNAPSANILENTIGNIVWSYSSAGNYLATLEGAFTSQKTFFYVSSQAGYNTPAQIYTQYIRNLTRITDGIVNLNQTNLNFTAGVFSSAGSVNDFGNLYLEIRVYN